MADTIKLTFDLGGTNTRIAIIDNGSIGRMDKFLTPADSEAGIAALIESAQKLASGKTITGICGDVSGITKDNVIYHLPNLPRWDKAPLARRLQQAFNTPVTIFNDVELIGLGEYLYGAGKGEANMFYLTVSTGVGGALIRNGEIDRGEYNMEVGHQIIDGGRELEELISGTAVEKKYGIHPGELTDEKALEELADTLATGLYNVALHLSPECVVLGGAMIVGRNPIPIKRTEETLKKMIGKYYPSAPRIKKATLGDQGGLYGGMGCLARD